MRRGMKSRATSRGAWRALLLALTAGVVWAGGAREVEAQARAQQRGDLLGSIGAGGTLYVVDTRLDQGHTVRGSLAYAFTPAWLLEAGVRRHGCLDCDRFWIVDAGVQWQYPGERFSPFISAGGGRASDPGFMGTEWGAYASVGSGVRLNGTTSLQLELRVRQLGGSMGSPDGMGELTMGVTRRMWARSP